MRKLLKSIFLNKVSFIVFGILAFAFFALWTFFCIINGPIQELVSDGLIYMILLVGLLLSYLKCETNVQKVLLGALFLLLCNSSIEILFVYLGAGDTFLTVLYSIICFLSVAIFVSHIVLQSDHIGSNKAILFNQFAGLMIIAIAIVGIRQAFFVENVSILDMTFIPAWAFTYLFIICIETRVQEYKKIRNEAIKNGTWNDETRRSAKLIFKI